MTTPAPAQPSAGAPSAPAGAAPAAPDPELQRFRERVAAGIALIVVAGSFVLMAISFLFIGEAEQFNRVKDLLLIVNPFLGVVIGYYFNKTSSDARAERAEATVQHVSTTAQVATTARTAAEEQAKAAGAEAAQLQAAFAEVEQAANQMLQQTPAPAGGAGAVLGGSGGDEDASFSGGARAPVPLPQTAADAVARAQLQAALLRAKKIMAR